MSEDGPRLTRRDAVLALAALGVGAHRVSRLPGGTDESDVVETLLAATDVTYPSAVDVDASFVETYVLGRAHADADYDAGVRRAVATLDRVAHREYAAGFAALSVANRRDALRSLGVHAVHSLPDGDAAQRVRYYVVHDPLYALYTLPLGGELLGVENPPGYPGGRAAYQRGPER